jgi:ribonuclease HI
MDEQRQNCLVRGGLAAGGIWYALTRTSTLDPQVKARLVAEANPVHVFSRGTRAAAARGSWRKGILRATKTAEGWTLWASSAAVAGRQRRAELKLRLQNLRLTADGVDPSDPYGSEAAYGPMGTVYQYAGLIVATDGSLKDDGRMGAAFVSMGNRLPGRSVTVLGSASSTRPELTGIALALEASPPDEDLTILTDSLVAMTTLFSLRRADFPLSLYRNACRQLITHVVQLLNRRHAAGGVTRIVKVKSHCGEPLNEAADALASAAAEADDSQLSNELHLEPDSVHFYLDGCPMTWGIQVRNRLTKAAADRIAVELGRPRIKRDGTVQPVTLTTAWLLRQDQGRQVLGRALSTLKTNSMTRRVLQTIAGTFPGNALLCRWKQRATAACDLCACPAETQAHIQCVCPALKGARIAAHHTLAGMVFNAIRAAGGGWDVHRELTVAGLQGIPVPADAMQDWYRMFDYLTDGDLMTDTAAELSLASGIRRTRPDGWAVHWNRRMIRILEFTRCNDSRPDWRETTEQYKTGRYQPLRDRMTELLPPGWSVEIVNFTVGIRGSFAETSWRAALTALGVSEAGVKRLMAELVTQCLTELNELYSTRATALRLRVDAHA